MKKLKTCRSCGSGDLVSFLSLGRLPLLTVLGPEQLSTAEQRQSLEAAFCKRCNLVQLISDLAQNPLPHTPPSPSGLFERLLHERHLGPHHLVISLGGNTADLLRLLMQAGVRVLQIEPQSEQLKGNLSRGIPTRNETFDRNLSQALREEGLRGDVVLANQILSQSPDLNGTLENLIGIVKDSGLLMLELPYLRDLLEQRQFNQFHHADLNYFSVTALHDLLRRHGLWLQRVEPSMEGYLRYYVSRSRGSDASVAWYLEDEKRLGLTSASYYLEFSSRIAAVRDALVAMLTELKARGRRIAAYGATAQSTTLLNYVGLGREIIEFVLEAEPTRQGKYLSGVHIPTYSPMRLLDEQPDYVLLLAGTLEDMSRQYEEYLRRGGKFIIPLPHPEIINPSLETKVRVGV